MHNLKVFFRYYTTFFVAFRNHRVSQLNQRFRLAGRWCLGPRPCHDVTFALAPANLW